MAFAFRRAKAGHQQPRTRGAGARIARAIPVLLLLFLLVPASAGTSTEATRTVPETLPLIFELNAGQTSPAVKFLSRGAGYTLVLTPAEMVLGFDTAPATRLPSCA
jgi:hypothetical protein